MELDCEYYESGDGSFYKLLGFAKTFYRQDAECAILKLVYGDETQMYYVPKAVFLTNFKKR